MSNLYNISQLDKKLSISLPPAPRDGWIKTIRTTIGMTYTQLANQIGISKRRLITIEGAEADQKLKLETLARVADALGCELHYALIPKKGKSFMQQLEAKAMKKAHNLLVASGQQMSLEDQLAKEEITTQAKILAQESLHGNLKALWDE